MIYLIATLLVCDSVLSSPLAVPNKFGLLNPPQLKFPTTTTPSTTVSTAPTTVTTRAPPRPSRCFGSNKVYNEEKKRCTCKVGFKCDDVRCFLCVPNSED